MTEKIKIQNLILLILGVMLIIVALFLQISAWQGAHYQRRIQSWGIKIPLDCNAVNTYQQEFQPNDPLIGNPTLIMRGPLLPTFPETHISGKNIPEDILRESFSYSGIAFSVSWQIFEQDRLFQSGVFGPNDVIAWSFPDYVYYKAEEYSGPSIDIEKVYTLKIEVTQPCKALENLNPTFLIGPPYMKNLIRYSKNTLKLTMPLLIIGIFSVIVVITKHKP